MESYTFGGIDIGSNAMRLLVTQVYKYKEHTKFRKISYLRYPIRLGMDVFDHGSISKEKEEKIIKILKAYKLVLEAHDVIGFRACATSAMREAGNGPEVVQRIIDETGIDLETISGNVEADIIYSKHLVNKLTSRKNSVFIDVGGGSTEVTVFVDKKKVVSKSFPIGTIRLLLNKCDHEAWLELEEWLADLNREYKFDYSIGTGGNINKVAKLLKHKQHAKNFFMYKDIIHLQEKLEAINVEERIIKYRLKPDRADVITHALDIYTFILRHLNIEEMHIPKIGLADGMIRDMYRKQVQNAEFKD